MPKLRNRVNWVVGISFPVGLFLLATLTGLGSTFTGVELAAWVLGFFLASLGAYVLLGRPYVIVASDELVVRNPISLWRIPQASIDSVSVGSSGFPQVDAEGRCVRLWALEESLTAHLLGGFEKLDRVRGRIGAVPSRPARGVPECRRSLFDKGSTFITIGWSVYYAYSALLG